MANSAKRDAKKAELAERTRRALELRRSGASYEQIARSLNLADRSNARRAVMDAIKEIIEEPAREVLSLELERLDAMLLGLWTKARAGDIHAVDRVLRIQERRAAYLGLDKDGHFADGAQVERDINIRIVKTTTPGK